MSLILGGMCVTLLPSNSTLPGSESRAQLLFSMWRSFHIPMALAGKELAMIYTKAHTIHSYESSKALSYILKLYTDHLYFTSVAPHIAVRYLLM